MASFTDMFGSRSITQTTDGEDFLTYSSSDPDLSSPSSSNPATVNSPFSDTTSHEIMSESPDSGLWISLGILVSILFLVILYSAFHFSRRRHHRARGKQGDHRKASSNEGFSFFKKGFKYFY